VAGVSAPKLDLAALRANSTPGPWHAERCRIVAVDAVTGERRGGMSCGAYPTVGVASREGDAELMAAAPALLERLERAEDALLRVCKLFGDVQVEPDHAMARMYSIAAEALNRRG
jgi:hypothetical protein